ncbi:MAG: enoyl-CoA hydratase/isomerase family protein [Burkholderiaceae bacterium]
MHEGSTGGDGTSPILEIQGQRAVIRLNRPRVLNRLQPEDVDALAEMLDAVERSDEVRVLILTGTGRVFSAGYDLGDLARRRAAGADAAPSADKAGASGFVALLERLEAARVPTICRLNGSVYGGATDVALCCDFRIGVTGSEMFMPASKLGLHYYTEGLERWTHRLGLGAAKRLFLTSDTIDCQEMLRIGYLDQLVAPEQLDAAVDQLADTLASRAPRTVEGMKQALNQIARGELDRAACDARHRASLSSEDIREGVAAWQQKRRPVFSGR